MQGKRIPTYGEGRRMKSPDFEIYHFFDSRPSNIMLHHHDFYEIYYLLSGEMDYIVDGRRYALHPGSLLFIAPDELHRPDIAGMKEFERFVLWIDPAFLSLYAESFPGLSGVLSSAIRVSSFLIPDSAQRTAMETLLSSLEQEDSKQEECRSLMCHSIIIQLLIHIWRMLKKHQGVSSSAAAAGVPPAGNDILPTPDISAENLHDVFGYIQEHLSDNLSVSALAERFFFNPNTLARLFKAHAGIPLGEYVRKKRLAAARLYMYQGMSAVQAGSASGFSDYSTFYRAFKREYGVSPKEFVLHFHQSL